jgi:hypothetical protein
MRPTFNVTEFHDVVNVQMNKPMRDLIISLISDCEDDIEPELRAFRRALSDPQGAQIRRANMARQPVTKFSPRFRNEGYRNEGYRNEGYRNDRREDSSYEPDDHRE